MKSTKKGGISAPQGNTVNLRTSANSKLPEEYPCSNPQVKQTRKDLNNALNNASVCVKVGPRSEHWTCKFLPSLFVDLQDQKCFSVKQES